jgi:hypothetical protein
MAENPIKLNLNNKKQSDLHDQIVKKYHAQQNLKKAKKMADEINSEVNSSVEEFMEQEGADAVLTSFYVGTTEGKIKKTVEKSVRLMKVVRRKVIFDADALEEKLGKEFCRNFIHRQYEITDWDGMVKLLKSYGVKPKEFLPFINLIKTVDEVALTQMESLGDISKSDIEGTYEVRELSNYLQMDEFGAKKNSSK